MPVTAVAGRRWSDASNDSVRWLDMSDGYYSCPRSWTTDAPEPQAPDDGATNSTAELE